MAFHHLHLQTDDWPGLYLFLFCVFFDHGWINVVVTRALRTSESIELFNDVITLTHTHNNELVTLHVLFCSFCFRSEHSNQSFYQLIFQVTFLLLTLWQFHPSGQSNVTAHFVTRLWLLFRTMMKYLHKPIGDEEYVGTFWLLLHRNVNINMSMDYFFCQWLSSDPLTVGKKDVIFLRIMVFKETVQKNFLDMPGE